MWSAGRSSQGFRLLDVKLDERSPENYLVTEVNAVPGSDDRISVRSWARVPRPLDVVWDELMALAHPAWSDPAVETFVVPGVPLGQVGYRQGMYSMPYPDTGIPQVTIVELTGIAPRRSLTVETVAGPVPYRERIEVLADANWTIVVTELSMARLGRPDSNLQDVRRLLAETAEQWLQRGANWQPVNGST